MKQIKNKIGIGRLNFLLSFISLGIINFFLTKFLDIAVENWFISYEVSIIFAIVLLVINWIIVIKVILERLKNIGGSLWWILLLFIPFIDFLFLIYLLVVPAQKILIKER